MTKSQAKKISFVVISCVLIAGLFFVLTNLQNSKNSIAESSLRGDGVQIVEVFAKNGYTPSKVIAKANTPTILRIKTENTYDCSAALSIPQLNYNKFLPPSGSSEVQILPQKNGDQIVASCSMGMYGFTIEFV